MKEWLDFDRRALGFNVLPLDVCTVIVWLGSAIARCAERFASARSR